MRAILGARFLVVEAAVEVEQRLEVLIALEDQGWVEGELEAHGAARTGSLLDGGSSFRLTDGSTLDVIAREAPWLAQALDCPRIAPNGLPVIGLPYLVLFRLETGRSADVRELERLLGGASEPQLFHVRAAVDAFMPEAREELESLITIGRLERQSGPKA